MQQKEFDLTHWMYARSVDLMDTPCNHANDNDEGIAWHNDIIDMIHMDKSSEQKPYLTIVRDK